MSNIAISANSTLSNSYLPVKAAAEPKSADSTQVEKAPAAATDKVELSDKKLSLKSIGAIAGSSLLAGGAISGLGGLLMKSAGQSTGAAAIFGTLAGAALVGTGAVAAVGGGIGGSVGAAVADTPAGGFGLGAAAGALLVGGATYAISHDLKFAALIAAPAAVAAGVGGMLGVKYAK